MFIKQLSVFIENRKGRLEEVTAALTELGVNIVALSLADTNEYGLLRLIVSEPDKAKAELKTRGFSATLTDVLAVKLSNCAGALHEMLVALAKADLNIEYMYVLDSGTEYGSMAVKVTDKEKALEAIRNGGLEVLAAEKAYAIHH
ncbi:MAG: amino acid-binding protein [Oscillospiraceae bacterium]|jgi:hypothetical protein|nr:amino acid-binding protein [Oscillospiraceae bacterium]